MSNWNVVRMAGAMGAELAGLDLAKDRSAGLLDDLVGELWEHQVLVLRGQTLSPEQHLEIAEHFGEVEEQSVSVLGDRPPVLLPERGN